MMRGLLLAVVCLVAACSFLSPGKSGGRECRSYCNDRVTECLRECADCTGAGAPYRCCTGFGTGTCDQPSSKACTSSADCTDGNGTWPDCQQRDPGAFNAQGGGAKTITETGLASGDLTDGLGHAAAQVSIFCIAPTFNPTVDAAGDLPGPGAVSLPGTQQLLP